MKLADEHGMRLLERVIRLLESFEGRPRPLFDAMVEVARRDLQRRGRLTDAELIMIMRKP
jgi:hypothetical protein